MLFQPGKGWKQIELMQHSTLQLSININTNDYHELGRPTPKVQPTKVTVVTDSCLWGMSDFIRCGFTTKDLLLVKHTSSNKEKIEVLGENVIHFMEPMWTEKLTLL